MAKTAPETIKLSPDLSSQELDQITLSKSQFTKGFIRFILCTAVAIFVFFTNLTIGGESQIVFGWIYNFFVAGQCRLLDSDHYHWRKLPAPCVFPLH